MYGNWDHYNMNKAMSHIDGRQTQRLVVHFTMVEQSRE